MTALILAAAAALALLVPPGPEGVMLGALFTAALFAGTALAGTFAASAIAFTLNVIVGSVVSFALSKVTAALAGKPKAPKVTPFGIQGSLRTGGDVPRSIIVGRGATAGSLVWANAWGAEGDTPNAYLTQVIALSDMFFAGVSAIWINGEAAGFGDGTLNSAAHGSEKGVPILQYRRGSVDHLWVKIWNGKQTIADPFLTGTASTAGRVWESTRVGTGVAYAVITCRFNRDVFTGVPSFVFQCDGIPLYDPSRDTTAGGSGTHRWADPVTWQDATDSRYLAPVILYNLLRGVRLAGQWVMGLQSLAAAQLPDARWVAAINAARSAAFYAGGEITFDTELGDTVEALLASCEGRLADNAGTSYGLSIGAPGSAVASFTDADIITTAEQSFTPFPGLADTVNGVVFSYPRPSQAWAVTQAPPLYDAALEAEDGGRRLPVTIDMPMVSADEQAQRLAKAALAEARRARRHTITLPPQFWPLEPGDVVAWTSERNGYAAKLFRVDGLVDMPDLDVMVDLTEVDPADYDWDSGVDFTPVADGFLGAVRPPVQSTSVSVAPHTITVAGVGRRPALALSWTNAPSDVVALDWQVRIAATAALVAEGTAPGIATGSSGSTILSSGIVANTGYQVRARWVPGSARPVDWSSWLPVTAPNVLIGVAEFAAGIEPVAIVTTTPLPTTKITEVIFYAADDKLYRWNGTAYTAAVDGGDVVARSITAGKIAVGAIGATEIAADQATIDKFAANNARIKSANIDDLAVNTLKLAGQAVTLDKLQQNVLVTTPAVGTGAFVLTSVIPAFYTIPALDLYFPVGARGASVTAFLVFGFNGRQGNSNYPDESYNYGLNFRVDVFWPGGGQAALQQEFSRGLYEDDLGQIKSRGGRAVVLTFPALEGRAGTNLARVSAVYSDSLRDESFSGMSLYLLVVNN